MILQNSRVYWIVYHAHETPLVLFFWGILLTEEVDEIDKNKIKLSVSEKPILNMPFCHKTSNILVEYINILKKKTRYWCEMT